MLVNVGGNTTAAIHLVNGKDKKDKINAEGMDAGKSDSRPKVLFSVSVEELHTSN